MQIKLKLNLFKKIFLFFLIVVVIPTISISSIYVYNYSVELKDKYRKMLDTDVHNLSSELEMLISQMDRLSVQLSLLTNLNSLLAWPDVAAPYDYYVLQNNLRDQVSVNGITESAYIYFQLSDRVLTTNEGLYSRDLFYDKSVIDRFLTNGGHPYEVRQVQSGIMQPPVDVISFDRTLPSMGKYTLGHLVINVKKNKFFEAFHQLTQVHSGANYIIDLQNQTTLFQTGNTIPSDAVTSYLAGRSLSESQDTMTVKLNGQKYFLSYLSLKPQSWVIVQLMPYVKYEQEFGARLKSTAVTTTLVMIVGLLLSYIFALMIYNPWKQIITRYQSIFKTATPIHRLDEYSLIREGIDHLLHENERVQSTIEQVEPLVKHRLIYDLLHNGEFDSLTGRLLEDNGIRFTSTYFTVCLVAPDMKPYENSADLNRIKLVLFGLTKDMLQSQFEVAGTILEEGRFAFILGLAEASSERIADNGAIEKEWKQSVTDVCRHINESVQSKFYTGLQFSFGKVSNSIFELHESYMHAKRGFKYKALLNKSDVVFMTDLAGDKTFPYPVGLQKMLTEGIKTGDKKQTGDAISALFQQYVHNDKFPLDRIRQMIIILMSTVIQELIKEGYDMDELGTDHIFRIDDCSNNHDLEQLIRDHIHSIIDNLDSWESKKSENIYVAKTIRYMEEHYSGNNSIGDIAHYVGVSPNYLSRIFKTETGSTPLDYLTRYRINQGKKLLVDDERYSLQEIGNRIGYNEVQSFIRFFKKYEGVTPSVYRKTALLEKANGTDVNNSTTLYSN